MIKTLITSLFISLSAYGNFVEFPKLYTRAEMKRLSKVEFNQIISEASSALPLKKDYPAQKAGEVAVIHHEWKDAGAALHEIAQIIKVNKAHSANGLEFLKECAKNRDVRTEFAAICLTHYSVFFKVQRKIKIDKKEFPQEVVNLSSFITD
ncbi:hypothetical protein [Halobacteriovorax sp.]|uniref:hypothetical protein n=1 Tax=Halobacteriovorax sp. TaxID=2020862 RepID=UPI0035635DB6